MVEHVWDDLLSEQDKAVITKAGYDQKGASSWDSRGVGKNPLVLVIDMQRLIIGDDVPILEAIEDYRTAMGSIAWEGIEHIQEILSHARQHDVPVWYTRVVPSSYDDPDHENLEIVEPVAPMPEDRVFDKSYASAFYGTDLQTRLVQEDIDTLIVVGNSTSGCIRTSVVDAQQRGYHVVVPHQCVFDRIRASHKIGMLDLWMKYADVVDLDATLEFITEVKT